jgi:hypothetical protein
MASPRRLSGKLKCDAVKQIFVPGGMGAEQGLDLITWSWHVDSLQVKVFNSL